MAEHHVKSFAKPDEVLEFPRTKVRVVELGDITVGRLEQEPGWSWRECMQPTVGGEWCQARHLGMIISGRLGVELEDGTTFEVGPDEVFDIPPGHNGWVAGDEPLVQIEWAGIRAFAGFPTGIHSRVLVTLLFTDVVGSTALAAKLGDARWRELLSAHDAAVRREVTRFRGREVKTLGDGSLSTFDGPARAIRCGGAITDAARSLGLEVRVGLHSGEVELMDGDVGGIAVHIAARIGALADGGEVLVSSTVKDLVAGSGIRFEDRGMRRLKGISDEWRLFAAEG
jgi:class 3 adenylate cyclase